MESLIVMSAPRRSAPRRSQPTSQGLLAKANIPASSDSIFTDTAPVEQPMFVNIPGKVMNESERALLKFSQLILMCTALAAIWGGLFGIATADDATTNDFFIIFVGGLASAAISIGWIEVQSKKNGHVLYEVQDYMLGMGFFFATIGMIWGTRWFIGVVTGEGWTEIFGTADAFNSGFKTNANGEVVDWYPHASAIYVQTAAILALVFGQIALLKRYTGSTGFGRAVAAYAPILFLVGAGMGPWMTWSENEVSYELGIAVILLCFASMEMALRSNKALNFVVVAVVSGLTPILLEIFNTGATEAGEGGAMSLLIFIVAIQGYYAARQELRSELIQKASIVLVGEIVLAMWLARVGDLNLHLGPIKTTELELESVLGLSAALWIAVLVFYFPAVQQRRVPWMPIGLAAALVMLPNDGSVVPWGLTLLMIPYMLFFAKATRRWVADYTFTALALAYFFTDNFARISDIPLSETFGMNYMHVLIPISLFVISELARQKDKISTWTHLTMLASIVLSRAILQAEDWFMPWIFIAYMLYLARSSFFNLQTDSPLEERKQATLVVLITSASMIVLSLLDRLDVPAFMEKVPLPEYFNYQIFILGAATYIVMYPVRNIELDIGLLFNWFKRATINNAPVYNPATNSWTNAVEETDMSNEEWFTQNTWSQLTRFSLLIPFFMMSFSIITMVNPWEQGFNEIGTQELVTGPWIMLLLVPIIGLVLEIKQMKVISSVVRSAGVWVLFTISLPICYSFNVVRDEMRTHQNYEDVNFLPMAFLLDAILLSAPLYVNSLISKRGIDVDALSPKADVWAMLGLIGLACLDTSGGLLLISMIALVTVRCVKHRHVFPLLLSPLAFFLANSHWLDTAGLGRVLIEKYNPNYEFAEWGFLTLSKLGGILITLQMTYVLFMDHMYVKESKNRREPLPWYGIWGWALIGILAATSSIGWIPAIMCVYLIFNSWNTGRLEAIVVLHVALMFSLMLGMVVEDIFVEEIIQQSFSWSSLITACSAMTLFVMNGRGLLFKEAAEGEELVVSIEKREEIVDTIYITAYIFFILSFEALFGIGTLTGAILLTRDFLFKGYHNALFFVPAIHAIALANLIIQMNIGIEIGIPIGIFLTIEGLAISWFALQNDRVFELEYFEWKSDDEFLDFLDRLGMTGILSALVGVFFMLGEVDQWSFAWLLTTVILIAVGIQGYAPEHEARWRRILGGYGSIVSFSIFSIQIESSDTLQALSFVGVGLIALGWGFLTMQKLDDDEGIYEVQQEQKLAPQLSQTVDTRKPAFNPKANTALEIPEPVTQESYEDELETTEEVEEEVELIEAIEDELEIVEEVEEEVEMVEDEPEIVEEVEDEIEIVQEAILPPLPETITTQHGFDIRLPDGKLEAIISSIENTPHEGYKPVVGLNQNGQIVIDWVSV